MFPKNQANSKTPNACKVTFHITHCAAGATVREENKTIKPKKKQKQNTVPSQRSLMVTSDGSFRLAAVSFRRLTAAVKKKKSERVGGAEQPRVCGASHGYLDL